MPLADDLFVFQPPPGSKLGELMVPGGLMSGVAVGAPPPPLPTPAPPRPPKGATPQRIHVDANVQQGKLLQQPRPVYPPLAKKGGIRGVVKLTAIIAKDGTIQSLKVISGPELLTQAALDAVKHWVYQPMTVNGEPVEVVTEIDVPFTIE